MNFDFLIWSIFSSELFILNFLRLNLSPFCQFQTKTSQKWQTTDLFPKSHPNLLLKLECPKSVLTAVVVVLCSIQPFVIPNWQRGTRYSAENHRTDAVMVANVHRGKDFELFLLSTIFLISIFPCGVTRRLLERKPAAYRQRPGIPCGFSTSAGLQPLLSAHLRLELGILGYSAQSPTDLGLWGQYMPWLVPRAKHLAHFPGTSFIYMEFEKKESFP